MATNVDNIDNSGNLVMNQTVNAQGGTVNTGDVTQNTYEYKETNPSFSEIDFEQEEDYPLPKFTEDIFKLILQKRVIILKGNNHFDLFSFGRRIVKKLLEKFPSYTPLELIQNEEDKPLNNQLTSQKTRQIILLNGIHPRHISHNISQLIEISDTKQSFYIINTEVSETSWMESGVRAAEHWIEIPKQNLYDSFELMNWFIEKIENNPIYFLNETIEISPTTLFSDSITLSEIIEVADTPQKLTLFLSDCREKNTRFSDKELESILKKLNNTQEEIVTTWFNNLHNEQKIIALSAALFNGLFCNQYFEILSKLIKDTFWKQSENTLQALDYHNLDFLSVFFRFETTDEGDLIVARNATIRVNLLKTAIHQYPRHIHKALLVFSEIMQLSYKRKIDNWELHGTTEKRALLRQVFIESTRDIGVNELTNIESIYLELAASKHHFIQGIAARSLAQYRVFNKDDFLFETLNKWLKSDTIKQRIDVLLQNTSSENEATLTAIKSTTIRTLAYAADYDQPNKLHLSIREQLITYANDPNIKVQESVAKVLPKFITHHSYQLRNEIFDFFMPKAIYSSAISDGLMASYNNYPAKLKDVMNHWLSICMKDKSESNRREKTTQRDNTLIAVLNTLRKIKLHPSGYRLEELYAIGTSLLKVEKRTAVINAILHLLASAHAKDYPMAFDYIPSTIMSLTKEQRKIMVSLWANEFVEQRQNLPNGEFTIIVYGNEYPAWNSFFNRPLTRIEETLFTWLNSDIKGVHKFAILTFLEIACSFEKQEYKVLKAYRKHQEEMEKEREARRIFALRRVSVKPQSTSAIGLGFWLRIKIFFYLLFEKHENKKSLKQFLKMFLNESYSEKDLQFVIYKWEIRNKGILTTKLAKWLKRLIVRG